MPLTVDTDMTEPNMEHPTAGRRRRHKSPATLHVPVALPVPRLGDHLDTENGPSDEEGEKEAKRQRSEPTTPISTSSRLPYEYDRVMGITQVGSEEAEGFDEGLDLEYHDATEDLNVLQPEEHKRESVPSHGGCGSSSLRECIELLNNPERKAPATCHSGPKMEKKSGPPQVMSPNVEEGQTTVKQDPSGSMPSDLSLLKEEPQVQTEQMKSEASTPKLEPSMTDVKEEADEFDTPGPFPDALQEEVQGVAEDQPLDSEDSLSQERCASELRRLAELRTSQTLAEMRIRVSGDSNQNSTQRKEPLLQLRRTQQPL